MLFWVIIIIIIYIDSQKDKWEISKWYLMYLVIEGNRGEDKEK